MMLANTERWHCTVRYGYSSLFFSFCLTSITLTHGEGIVCVDMAMDTLLHGTLGTQDTRYKKLYLTSGDKYEH